MLSVALFLTAGGLSHSATAACAPLDPQVLHERIEAVLQAAPDFSAAADAGGLLRVYWVSVCADERFGASAAVVDDLARLLEDPDSRWSVASKLLEIGPNLPHAARALDAAVRDQKRIDRARAKAAAPLETATFAQSTLKCVAHKIRTGEIDPELCAYVDCTEVDEPTGVSEPLHQACAFSRALPVRFE